jgi:hypothetical protein
VWAIKNDAQSKAQKKWFLLEYDRPQGKRNTNYCLDKSQPAYYKNADPDGTTIGPWYGSNLAINGGRCNPEKCDDEMCWVVDVLTGLPLEQNHDTVNQWAYGNGLPTTDQNDNVVGLVGNHRPIVFDKIKFPATHPDGSPMEPGDYIVQWMWTAHHGSDNFFTGCMDMTVGGSASDDPCDDISQLYKGLRGDEA